MKNKEEVFTHKEIEEIEGFAREHLDLKNPKVFNIFGPGQTTVWNISPVHELIIARGNRETGFEHIYRRHELWAESTEWIPVYIICRQ